MENPIWEDKSSEQATEALKQVCKETGEREIANLRKKGIPVFYEEEGILYKEHKGIKTPIKRLHKK